jgi:hypothetical protein
VGRQFDGWGGDVASLLDPIDLPLTVDTAVTARFATLNPYFVNDASTANDRWCTAPGDDANDGRDPARPKRSIRKLLSAYDLGPGDAIYIDTGRYEENPVVAVNDSGVWLIGAGRDSTTIAPVGNVRGLDADASCRIEDLCVTGGTYGIEAYTSTVRGCRVTGSSGHGIYSERGVRVFNADGELVLEHGVVEYAETGVDLAAAGSVTRTVIRHSRQTGLVVGAAATVANVICHDNTVGVQVTASGASLTNLTIADNGTGVRGTGAMSTLTNSIIWANDVALDSVPSHRLAYCCVQGPAWAGTDGNIHADPLFWALQNGDFHLMSQGGRWQSDQSWVLDPVHSPCIDAGDPARPYANETEDNGDRLNLGAYGNTEEASRSRPGPTGRLTIVAAGTGSGRVVVSGIDHELPFTGDFDLGASVPLRAEAGEQSEFSHWEGDVPEGQAG